MASIQLEGLTRRYGAQVAVDGVTLNVPDGELTILLGPSGCGKTTTLRMIAGFVEPSAGRIAIAGRDVTREPPWRRNIGLVFQSYALFPHLTVSENVAFGLRRRGVAEADIRARVARALELVRLGSYGARMPRALSGGQQQRVAIARAVVIEPDVLLLDEPLSNLDAKLREDVRRELRALQRQLGITTLMVTHDQAEAMALGDRLVVMSEGCVRQVGTPEQVYRQPADRFVAGFVGRCNTLPGRVDGATFVTDAGTRIPCAHPVPHARTLLLRPESISFVEAGAAGAVPAQVAASTFLGAGYEVQLTLAGNDRLEAFSPVVVTPGEACWVRMDAAAAILLPEPATETQA